MQELVEKIEHVEHLCPECINCVIKKHINKYPDTASTSEKVEYMQGVMNLISSSPKNVAIPVIIRNIENLRKDMFDLYDDYTEIKKHFNAMLLEQMDLFREKIVSSDDSLRLAIQLAFVGNYIDFAVVDNVDENFLNDLIRQAEDLTFDEDSYAALKEDLSKGGKLVYLTDNCGEIVMDRLLIEQIQKQYPDITVNVIVRGMNAVNDASMEDVIQVGLDQICSAVGNGTDIMGTWFPEISGEAADLIKSADVMISKGQGNFETLRRCGMNIYYLFLCKCDIYMNMFNVERFTAMLINDRSLPDHDF